MSLTHVSANIPAISAFGKALGATGAELAAEKGLLEATSSAIILPSFGGYCHRIRTSL